MNELEEKISSLEKALLNIFDAKSIETLNEKLDNNTIINVLPGSLKSFKTKSLLIDILNRLELNQRDRIDLAQYILEGKGGGDINVDTEMSNESTNPVANKTIKEYVDLHPRYRKVNEIEVPDIDVPSTGNTSTTVKLPVVYMYPETTEQLNNNIEVYNGIINGKINFIISEYGEPIHVIVENSEVTLTQVILNYVTIMLLNSDGSLSTVYGGPLYKGNDIYADFTKNTITGINSSLYEHFINNDVYPVTRIHCTLNDTIYFSFTTTGYKRILVNDISYNEVYGVDTLNRYYCLSEFNGNIALNVYKNAIIEITTDSTTTKALYNKLIFTTTSTVKIDSSIIIKDGENCYNALNVITVKPDGLNISAYDVTIYNNGFKTYRINSDGTTTLLTS